MRNENANQKWFLENLLKSKTNKKINKNKLSGLVNKASLWGLELFFVAKAGHLNFYFMLE